MHAEKFTPNSGRGNRNQIVFNKNRKIIPCVHQSSLCSRLQHLHNKHNIHNMSLCNKVFRLPQYISDEQDNQGNNLKFFLPKYKHERTLKIQRSGIYLISLFLTSSHVYILVGRILNYYPNYHTHHLYIGKVKTPHRHSA